MTEQLVALPTFAKLSEKVWRVLGLNPGKLTLQGTNTYLIGTGTSKILLDTGEGRPDYTPLLTSTLSDNASTLSRILLTHRHGDHWGGVPSLLESFPTLPVHKFPDPATDSALPFTFTSLHDGERILVDDDTTLRVIHTPGHTVDHCCFLLEEEDALFTGDAILGQGTAVFEDLKTYIESLKTLVPLRPKKLYPGHGPVIEEGVAKIEEYIRHREEREAQIIGVMRGDASASVNQDGADRQEELWTALNIVRVVYKGYPEALYPFAAHGVVLHLEKLEKEGKVIRVGKDDADTKWAWRGKL